MLRAKELALELGVSRKTITRWIKAGCPCRRIKGSKKKGGRRRIWLDLQKVIDWAGEHGIELKRDPGAVAASQKEVREQMGDSEPAPAPIQDADLPKSGIVGAIARLRSMERIAFAAWTKAIKAEESSARIRAKEKIYIEAHEALRRTEKDMPGILQHQGESISLEVVMQAQARINLAIKNELLTLPRKVAQELADAKSPAEVEAILIREVDDTLRHLSSGEALHRDDSPGV